MIVALVGMPGSGKSVAADYLRQRGIPVIRFGQIVTDEVARRGLDLNPANEQTVREDLRRQYGMDVCAQLSIPSLRALTAQHPLVGIDGLYSLSELKTLTAEFGASLAVLAIFTPRAVRYERLARRPERPLTPDEARHRDYREIETLEKGGPIALADLTLVNDGSPEELVAKVARAIEILQP